MKHLSEGRIEAISLAVMSALKAPPELTVIDSGRARSTVAECIRQALGSDTGLDQEVRQRIASLARPVPEGSREWDVLYRQYSEELGRRRG